MNLRSRTMTRFRSVFILSLFSIFLLFTCGKQKEKVQTAPDFTGEQEMPQPQGEALASEIEIEDEANYIEDDFNSLQVLPEGEELDFQEEGFAFPISYKTNFAQAVIPPGTQLQFLDHEKKKIHSAKALENFLFVDEMFEHKVTTTDLDSSVHTNLILFGEKPEVKWLEVKALTDAELTQELVSRIDLEKDYADAFENSGGPLKVELPAYNEEVTVYEFEFMDNRYFILSYTFAEYRAAAATFLLSPKQEYPLTGPCSFSTYPELFIIKDKLYLHSGSTCCECGISVQQLFEFDGTELKAVLEDGSWST